MLDVWLFMMRIVLVCRLVLKLMLGSVCLVELVRVDDCYVGVVLYLLYLLFVDYMVFGC